MRKHRLFTGPDSSPDFGSGLDESTSTRRTTRSASAMISKADAGVKNACKNKKGCATQSSVQVSEQDSESDSDSDSMNVSIFSSNNQKLPYSYEEDEEILRFIFKGQNIFRVSSILLWKDLEYKKVKPRRTYQSLKNRFLRNIKPKLFTFYKHLIPDDDTVEKILKKFPELKKQVNKKETLDRIRLPERIVAKKWSSCNSEPENDCDFENFEAVRDRFPNPVALQAPGPSKNLNFHRRVEMKEESLTVLVNLKYQHPPRKSTRIYERFLNLKLKNQLVPCPACGRSGGPEPFVDSGAESDTFISNSVESKKSESPLKRKLNLRKNRNFQSQKRKKKLVVPESHCSQVSCSPSLLNDVNQVDELGELAVKVAEFKRENVETVEPLNSEMLVKESDLTQEAPRVVSEETDCIYRKAVAEFRMLIDSDEEEMLVKKCLRKNSKTIGFDVKMSNMSMEDIHVDSYFIKLDSPVESASMSVTPPRKIKVSTERSPGGTLAQNMMNMLGNANLEPGFSLRKN